MTTAILKVTRQYGVVVAKPGNNIAQALADIAGTRNVLPRAVVDACVLGVGFEYDGMSVDIEEFFRQTQKVTP
jgi:hypothetical protein